MAARYFAEQGVGTPAPFVAPILDKDPTAPEPEPRVSEKEFHRLTGAEPLFIVTVDSRELGEGGAALKRVLASRPDTDAIAFSGDMLAVGAMFEADRMGLTIPRDLKLLGYGDLDIAGHPTRPSAPSARLTTRSVKPSCDMFWNGLKSPGALASISTSGSKYPPGDGLTAPEKAREDGQ